jgi:hypothetical protein
MSIRDQYSTLVLHAKEHTAQKSSAPCRFNEKGIGAHNCGANILIPVRILFQRSKPMPTENSQPQIEVGNAKDTKRTQQFLSYLYLIDHEAFPLALTLAN